jgi:DnaJ family protein C protein 17
MERPDTPSAAAATAADKERVSTPTASAGSEERKPSQEASPSVPKSANGDEYDDRIAELEKRLKEKQERKAARKTDKRSRKSDISSLSSRRSPPAAGDTPTKPPPPNPADESKADGEKAPPESRSFSFRPYAASAPSSPATTKTGSGSLPQFATTMARLKAAQARREEEKRKRAETASEQAV